MGPLPPAALIAAFAAIAIAAFALGGHYRTERDRLTMIAAAFAMFVVIALLFTDMIDYLRHFPAPTASWATIITGLAWPVLILLFAMAFRSSVDRALAALVRRVEAGDGLKMFGIEIQAKTRDEAKPEQNLLSEWLAMPGNEAKLQRWLDATYPANPPKVSQFLFDPLYSGQIATAYIAVSQG